MTNPNDPITHDPCRDYGCGCSLTKREYFAAMAMQGIVSDLPGAEPSKIAITAVLIADSLLLELSK